MEFLLLFHKRMLLVWHPTLLDMSSGLWNSRADVVREDVSIGRPFPLIVHQKNQRACPRLVKTFNSQMVNRKRMTITLFSTLLLVVKDRHSTRDKMVRESLVSKGMIHYPLPCRRDAGTRDGPEHCNASYRHTCEPILGSFLL
jgi:hypothetical protein